MWLNVILCWVEKSTSDHILSCTYSQEDGFLVKLICDFFWEPNISISFLFKYYCILLRTFFLWTKAKRVQFSQILCGGTSCLFHAIWKACCVCSWAGAPCPYLFSPENPALGSLPCQHAVGWPVHTWTLPLVPLPWCSSKPIISLWQWQSQTLCSVPGIQNKRAMPALEGDCAAASKSECRDDSEVRKLFGTQNLQL